MIITDELYRIIKKKAYSLMPNKEQAEDVAHTAVVKLLKYDKPVDSPANFARSTVKQVMLNYLTVNKKYVFGDVPDVADGSVLEDVMFSRRLPSCYAKLSKMQQKTIKHVLQDNDLCDCEGDKNTFKSHYNYALKKLRKEFKVE